MRSVESEGETIDEAIERALAMLSVDRERAEIEILEDAMRGLFGFGGRPARVRATVRPPVGAASPPGVSRETANDPSGASPETAAPSRGVERAQMVLEQILRHLGIECTIAVRSADEPGSVILALEGGESGIIIGRRGETLDALEYLVNRITSRDDVGPNRVLLDVEGYRERRRTSLEDMARRMAEKAKQSHRVVPLNPMSPRDRRIVHLALQATEGVTTRSQGTGYYRRVLVVPANAAPGPSPRTGARRPTRDG